MESLCDFAGTLLTVSCGVLRLPSAFLCIGLVCRSRSHRRPSRRILDGSIRPLRVVALAPGVFHRAVGSVGAHGIHLVSHYTGPDQSLRSGRSPLGALVGVYSFSLRSFLQVLHGDHSLFYACLSLKCPIGLCCTATCSDECPDCHRVHSSHFQDSVDSSDGWSRQQVPEATSDRHSVAVALSSSL